MICIGSEDDGGVVSWTSATGPVSASTPAPSAEPSPAKDAKDTNPETPWGMPVIGAPTGCDNAVSPVMSVNGHATMIRGVEGHICEYWLTADTPNDRNSEELRLRVPLLKPLALGTSPVTVVLTYHAERRQGWAKGRLAAQVNDGSLFFDRLGTDGTAGEIRIPVMPSAVLMASGLTVKILLQGEAQLPGFQLLSLDAVTIEGQ